MMSVLVVMFVIPDRIHEIHYIKLISNFVISAAISKAITAQVILIERNQRNILPNIKRMKAGKIWRVSNSSSITYILKRRSGSVTLTYYLMIHSLTPSFWRINLVLSPLDKIGLNISCQLQRIKIWIEKHRRIRDALLTQEIYSLRWFSQPYKLSQKRHLTFRKVPKKFYSIKTNRTCNTVNWIRVSRFIMLEHQIFRSNRIASPLWRTNSRWYLFLLRGNR